MSDGAEVKNETKIRALRSDTLQTRENIIQAAEQLFALHGIDAVSLGEITRAAGQKNKSALNYHFGSREALLQAVIDRHASAIAAERETLLNAAETNNTLNLKTIVEALVFPLAAKLNDDNGGIAYLKISAQMLGSRDLHLFRLRSENVRRDDRLMKTLKPFIPELPKDQALIRMQLVSSLLFHSLADQANLHIEFSDKKKQQTNKLFVDSLISAITVLLTMNPHSTH